MHAEIEPLKLVRLNAPELYANAEFRKWFLSAARQEPDNGLATLATWHKLQADSFDEYSDCFMILCLQRVDQEITAEGSNGDMPETVWRHLVNAVVKALPYNNYVLPCEVVLWLSNLPDESLRRINRETQPIVQALRNGGFNILSVDECVKPGDRLEIFVQSRVLDAGDLKLLTQLNLLLMHRTHVHATEAYIFQFANPAMVTGD